MGYANRVAATFKRVKCGDTVSMLQDLSERWHSGTTPLYRRFRRAWFLAVSTRGSCV